MENRKNNNFHNYVVKIFKPFDTVRRITVNLLFWGVVILLLVGFFSADRIRMPGRTNALVLDIQGSIVEQFSGSTFTRAVEQYNGYDSVETLLWDLIDSVKEAETDNSISAILLDLRSMGSSGLGALTELRDALMEFRESGKKIIAYSDYYSQGQYFLATAADEIYADPMGDFLISGFAVYERYYGEGLERLGVDVNYFHAGKFKSYGEVYTRSSMSDAAREENKKWSGDLWNYYVKTVLQARSLNPDKFRRFIDEYDKLLTETGGDSVQAALNATLIDGLKDRKALQSRMTELCGYSLEDDTFNQIHFQDYLTLKGRKNGEKKNKVAFITATGTIYNGDEDPGNIGGDSLSELIDQVRNNLSCKALVLRIDSGGGSAFASEIIRRKLQQLRDAGVPVVISMGSVAASGGYWICTASDQIWAQPTTITGSIGVFSLVTTFEKPLNKYLGVNVDGVGTTWLAGAMRSDRDLDPRVGAIYQQSVDHTYREFLNRVAKARHMTVEQVDKIAQGRVWSGIQAKKLGLVDNLGGAGDAVRSAAKIAGLKEGEYSVDYVKPVVPLGNRLIDSLLKRASNTSLFREMKFLGRIAVPPVLEKLKNLEDLKDPSGVFALSTVIFQ